MALWLEEPPSLRQAAIHQISKSLWISYHLKYTPKEYSRFTDTRTYSQLVHFETQLQNVPYKMKMDIVSTFLFLNWELKFWLDEHDFLRPTMSLLPLLRWTAHGHIDGEETALAIVQSQEFDSGLRFRLACLHCLTDHTSRHFNPYRSNGYDALELKRGFGDHVLTPYWNAFHGANKSQRSKLRQDAAKFGAYASFSALKYFWVDLTKELKEEIVVQLIYGRPAEYYKALIFLMNKIIEERLQIADEKIYVQILLKFTELPYCRYFWKLHQQLMDTNHTLTKRDYYKIFHSIGRNYFLACEVVNVQENAHLEDLVKNYGKNFLHYFWNHIPLSYKVDLLGNEHLVDMIDLLFQDEHYFQALLECKKRSLWQLPIND